VKGTAIQHSVLEGKDEATVADHRAPHEWRPFQVEPAGPVFGQEVVQVSLINNPPRKVYPVSHPLLGPAIVPPAESGPERIVPVHHLNPGVLERRQILNRQFHARLDLDNIRSTVP
jgi:hypothetical protein